MNVQVEARCVPHGSFKVSMDARRILPSGGLGEFPGLCGLYSGPSPQESAGGPSQTGLALAGLLPGLTVC